MIIHRNGACKCCQKFARTSDIRDMWHCKECWDEHHNGKRDNDWLNEEDYLKAHGLK